MTLRTSEENLKIGGYGIPVLFPDFHGIQMPFDPFGCDPL